jgi:hypothetical protein
MRRKILRGPSCVWCGHVNDFLHAKQQSEGARIWFTGPRLLSGSAFHGVAWATSLPTQPVSFSLSLSFVNEGKKAAAMADESEFQIYRCLCGDRVIWAFYERLFPPAESARRPIIKMPTVYIFSQRYSHVRRTLLYYCAACAQVYKLMAFWLGSVCLLITHSVRKVFVSSIAFISGDTFSLHFLNPLLSILIASRWTNYKLVSHKPFYSDLTRSIY